jgi:hypothetical protein
VGNPALGYDPGYYGTLGFNTLTSPGLVTFDLNVNKNFQISEAMKLQFRAEFFNLLNRPNFNLPGWFPFQQSGNASVPHPDAGRITDTRTKPREVQFGLRFTF